MTDAPSRFRGLPLARRFAVVSFVAVAALTGCSSGGSDKGAGAAPSRTPSATPTSACHQAGDEDVVISGPSGDKVFTLHVGTGARAVVIVPAASESACAWAPFARRMAEQAQVAVWVAEPTSSTSGLSKPGAEGAQAYWNDASTLTRHAADYGASEVLLLGSGTGGVAALRQSRHDGDLVATMALSPDKGAGVADDPFAFDGLDGKPTVLFGAADTGYRAQVEELSSHWAGSSAVLHPIPGRKEQGVALLPTRMPDSSQTVEAALIAWAAGAGR